MHGREKKKSFIQYLPVYGCFSTGIIYIAIGIIAILSFLKVKRGGADEGSLIAYLHDFILGKILIWIILLGTISFITWRIYESIKDPYGYGNKAKGLALRTGIALSTIADALIVYTVIRILLGDEGIQKDGQPDAQRQLVSTVLQQPWGQWLIVVMGAIIFITAIVQLMYGLTSGYKERIDIDYYKPGTKKLIHLLAWAGYAARGIILSIIGFFFIKAGIVQDASYVVNTDKAFDFIGDHVGHVYFILVALCTICYGLFMFAFGVAHDADKD